MTVNYYQDLVKKCYVLHAEEMRKCAVQGYPLDEGNLSDLILLWTALDSDCVEDVDIIKEKISEMCSQCEELQKDTKFKSFDASFDSSFG